MSAMKIPLDDAVLSTLKNIYTNFGKNHEQLWAMNKTFTRWHR
jgi:hypothetical protein